MYNKNILIIAFYLLSFTLGTNISFAKDVKNSTKEKETHPDSYYFRQFQDMFSRIKKDYIQEPDLEEMTNEAINGMLRSLDPYSGYYTDEDLEFFLSDTEGEFGGIGVEIVPDSGAYKVITPIDDLPAYRAGIEAGDYIVGVNGELVSTMGYNKALREMRGEVGTKVNLLIIKDSDNTTKEIEITREVIKIKPIKFEIETDDVVGSVGYIRISAFNDKTLVDLKSSVDQIEKQLQKKNKTLDGIILDLRNNPGGLLEQGVAVCEYFIDSGVVVSTKGRNVKNNVTWSAGKFVPKAPKVPLVVLINSGSASAAEIVAGALQDHKRAILVGTTSYGKGLVQTFTQIGKNAAFKITTAKYYTPSGRSINAKGIEPDIFIENANIEAVEKNKDKKEKTFNSSSVKSYLKKYNKDDSLEDSDNTKKSSTSKFKEESYNKEKEYISSKKYKDDYQYARAYDLIRGLIINNNKNN